MSRYASFLVAYLAIALLPVIFECCNIRLQTVNETNPTDTKKTDKNGTMRILLLSIFGS
jgi:hypothetical protein